MNNLKLLSSHIGHSVAVERLTVISTEELLKTIGGDLIPRLLIACRAEEAPARAHCLPPSEHEIEAFAQVVLTQDVSTALSKVDALSARGVSTEMVLLDFIAPTARLLGHQWDIDLRTFTEVTTGLGVLQRVVQALGERCAAHAGHRGLCVLTAAPGEQHTLGLYLLQEFLEQASWSVAMAPGLAHGALVDLVAETNVEMVCISVSHAKFFAPLGKLIDAIKHRSMNPEVHIVVGGSVDLSVFAREQKVALLCDPREAVQWLEDRVVRAASVGKLS